MHTRTHTNTIANHYSMQATLNQLQDGRLDPVEYHKGVEIKGYTCCKTFQHSDVECSHGRTTQTLYHGLLLICVAQFLSPGLFTHKLSNHSTMALKITQQSCHGKPSAKVCCVCLPHPFRYGPLPVLDI